MITIDPSVLNQRVKFETLGVGDAFIAHGDLDAMLCVKTREVYFCRENTTQLPGNCVELANGYVWHLSGDALVQPVKIKVVRA